MPITDLLQQGENSAVEFKASEVRNESLAREMVAFANMYGGTILIGIADDGTVLGVTDKSLEERVANVARNNTTPPLMVDMHWHDIDAARVLEVRVLKGQNKPYQTLDGKFFIRVGSTNRQASQDELSRLFQQAGLVHFDLAPLNTVGANDLNPRTLQSYWQTYYDIDWDKLEANEKERLLINANMIDENKHATVGGLLLFGLNPQRALPQATITCAVFDGIDKTADLLDKKEIEGTLIDQIDQASAWIKLYLSVPSKVEGNRREERVAIPSKVLREVLVNALAHRDYSIKTQKVSVFIFKDRLEVTSPGKLPNTLTIEKLRYGHSAPRNMYLVKFLDNFRYIDGLGRGIPTIVKNMGDKVLFEEVGEAFRVTISLGDKPC